MARTIEIDGNDETPFIRLESLTIVESAYGGEVGIGGFNRDDVSRDDVPAMKAVTVDESDASPTRMFTGYTSIRNIDRGPFPPQENLRQWDVTILDLNTCLDDEVYQHEGANRPQETDYERITWMLGSPTVLYNLGVTAGVVPNTNTVLMDASDYRHRRPRDVLDECAEMAKKNYFLYDYDGTGYKLYYDLAKGTSLSSTAKLSTVLADIDESAGVFAFDRPTPHLSLDPTRVYSAVDFQYATGYVYLNDSTIADEFRRRENAIGDTEVKSSAKALVKAQAYLDSVSTELKTFTGTVSVPAANVNDIRAGMRIQVKVPHLGFDSYTWMRISRREVRMQQGQGGVSDSRYTITLEFAEDLLPGGGGGTGGGGTGTPPVTGSTTETAIDVLTRYQLRHERGAGPFGPDVLLGTEYYTVPEDFEFGALGPSTSGKVTRMPEANVPWEFTTCGIGEGAVAGLTTREAWYRFSVDLTSENVTGVRFDIAPFLTVDAPSDYNDSPTGMIVGSNTVICGIHTGAEPTDEGQYTEVGRIGDGGGTVIISRDLLIDAGDGYCWFVLAPGWEISDNTITCIPDPHPWGWGEAGDDDTTIVSGSLRTFYIGPASEISFDNTASGLSATDVQQALDELAAAPAPTLAEVLTAGNLVDGHTITADTGSGSTSTLTLTPTSGKITQVVTGDSISTLAAENSGVTASFSGTDIDERGFYALEDGIKILDGDNSFGSAEEVLTAQGAGGSNTALWQPVPDRHAEVHAIDGADHTGNLDANAIDYDHTSSGLTATDVQAAIDELAGAGAPAPTLADVVAAGNDPAGVIRAAAGTGNARGGEIQLDPASGGVGGNATVAGGRGDGSSAGGQATLVGGYNNGAGVINGGEVDAYPASGTDYGRVAIYTAGSTGAEGELLVATGDGPGTTLWTALLSSGAGAPGGTFTTLFYLDTTSGNVYAWDGAAYTLVGTTTAAGAAGGDLSGTYPNPSVIDDSHSHTSSTLPGLAPTGADYLVGTAQAGLSAEIMVGTSPGGELGGTWASPTVDATHSGSAHHTEDHDHDGSPTQQLLQANTHQTPDTDAGTGSLHHTIGSSGTQAAAGNHTHSTVAPTTLDLPSSTTPSQTAEGRVVWDSDDDVLTIGDGASRSTFGKLGSTNAAAVGTAAAGSSIEASRVDHVHPTGAGTPSTQAFGDSASTGTGPAAAMTDHKHAMPTGTAGPDADVTVDTAGAAGTANTAARSGHGHKVATYSSAAANIGTAAAGTSTTAPSRGDHVHGTGAGTPTNQAFGDSATTGSGPAAAMTDHKHGMPADPTSGQVIFSGAPDTATTTGDITDLAVTNAVWRWNGGSAATLHGLTGVAEGRIVLIENVTTSQTLTLAHQSATEGTAGRRIITPDAADMTLRGGESAILAYDNTTGRWRVVSENAATYTSNAAAVGTAAAGTAGVKPSRGDHVHPTGAGTPSTQAFGDAASTGSGPAAAMTDHKHAMPNSSAGPDADVTIDAAGAAGTASTAARSGHGHKVATYSSAAVTQAMGDAAAAGTSGTAPSRGDHKHGMPAFGTTAAAIGTSAGGSATTPSKSDHVHATGAGTPSTQAFGDAAATGSGPAAAMTDHKHAMPTALAAWTNAGVMGSSFPGSPATNDRFFRTDLAEEYFYDGTRWLTTQVFSVAMQARSPAAATEAAELALERPSTDKWVIAVDFSYRVRSGGTALDASNKWVVTTSNNGSGGATTQDTRTIASGSSGVYIESASTAVGALMGTTKAADVIINATKTGTPGNLDYFPVMRYRVVGT